ncbi:hypothetical protein JD844_027973 [Phrynosoma platyrhinos]|uniref:Bestrophin homolog n=1 Tax=Phrynosoma platyrhinos TaxID=52577 RepID=A0ABQ7SH45_PHRPL|nr:hypothetical protein JD844_027973 [Phrynosoma platyrhinos]
MRTIPTAACGPAELLSASLDVGLYFPLSYYIIASKALENLAKTGFQKWKDTLAPVLVSPVRRGLQRAMKTLKQATEMTVTYSSKVANATFFGFHRLLLKWKGSIYKLLYREFILFASLYTAISVLYRFFLTGSQKRYFEKLAIYCDKYAEQIPVTFVLGKHVFHDDQICNMTSLGFHNLLETEGVDRKTD